jgi:acetolactate synthase-1/2/3 large subunit
MPTGADLLVDELYRQGVRDLFGMPGSHSTSIYDALARKGGIRTILIRNEQAGAYAADGYSRSSGRPGIICTTAGPGATNALSGIAEAYSDTVPVLLLTGQVNADRMHLECGAYHEIDLEGIFRPCTKYVATVKSYRQIPEIVDYAFESMTTGRPRSAAIILPQDIMGTEIGPLTNSMFCPRAEAPTIPMPLIRRGVEILNRSQRPIILAGGGAVWSSASQEIRELAQKLDCPVITSLNGKGILDERDTYSLGHARSVRAKMALEHSDCMIAIGCRFTEVLTWFGTMRVPDQLIQIDIDQKQIGMNYPVKVSLPFDARTTLQILLAQLPNARKNDWEPIWGEAKKAKHPQPEWFIETLRKELPWNGIVFTDASEMALRMQTDFPSYAPRTFFYPSTYIALGWGFPAAIGGAIANPERWVVSVSGDGGFTMTSQELSTAVRYNLKLIAIIHNDNAYGAIRNLQKKKHEARYHDTDLNNPDFMLLAQAYGLPGHRAKNVEEFRVALQTAMKRNGPSLIEVPDQWRSLRV